MLGLLGLGLVAEAIYAVSLAAFPLRRYYGIPLLDLGKLTDHGAFQGVLYLAALSLLFASYILALRAVRAIRGRAALLVVLLFASAFSLTLVATYPWGAADIYDYVIGGRIISQHQENPFITRGIDLPSEPWLAYAPWSDTTTAYGPLWAWLAAGATRLSGHHLLANIRSFKALAFVAYWSVIALVALIWHRRDQRQVTEAVLHFAWNPLVLLETLANGHNDALMIALLLLSLALLLRSRSAGAMVSLAASAMVKFVSGALLPLLLASVWKRGRGQRGRYARLALGLVAFAAPIALLAMPFWHEGDTLALGRRFQMFTTSLPTLVRALLHPWLGSLQSAILAQAVAWGLFCAFGIHQLANLDETDESLLGTCYEVIYFYLAFACAWFQPWYVVWVVALGALTLDTARTLRTHVFAYLALLSYFLLHFLWFWFGLDATPPSAFRVVASIVVILPQVGLWLWLRRPRRVPSRA